MGHGLLLLIVYLMIMLVGRLVKSAAKSTAARPSARPAGRVDFPTARAVPKEARPAPQPEPRSDSYDEYVGSLGTPRGMESFEGMSVGDSDGCVGGSLSHDRHEGLSPSDGAGCVGGSLEHSHADEYIKRRPQAAARKGETRREPLPRAKNPLAGLGLKPDDMRRALIYSEILSRPKGRRDWRRGA